MSRALKLTMILAAAAAALLLFASFDARPVQAQSGFTYDCSGGSGTTTNYFQYDFSIAETYAYGSWYNSGGTIGYSAGVGKTLTGSINNYLRYDITSWPSAPDIYQVTYTVSTNGNWGRLLIKRGPYWDNWADNLASGTRTSSAFSAGTFVTASPQFEADLRGATSLTFQSLKIVFRGACPYDPGAATPTPSLTPTVTLTPTQTLTPSPTSPPPLPDLTLGTPQEVTFTVPGTGWGPFDDGTYTVPAGAYLVGWLSRITSENISGAAEGLVRLDLVVGNYGLPAARMWWGDVADNYTCAMSYNVTTLLVPNWPVSNPNYACALFSGLGYSADGQNMGTYRDPADVVTLGGGYQWFDASDVGGTVVWELTPVLYIFEPAPTVTITCPNEVTRGYAALFEEEHTGSVTNWDWDLGDGETSDETDGDVEYTYYTPGEYTVEITVTGPGGSASDDCTFTVLRVGQPGSGGGGVLYRPLLTTDSDSGIDYTGTQIGLISPAAAWGGASAFQGELTYLGADEETVIGLAQQAAKVYAAADGTVLSVQLLPAGACDLLTGQPGNGVVCQTAFYGEDVGGDLAPFATMSVSTAGMYKVTMSYMTGVTFEYYVANAPLYVREGQQLLAGCIVGETVPYELVSNTIGVPNQVGKQTFWMQAVTTGGEQVPILAQLYEDPTPGEACNAGGEYSDCLFDPLFTDQGAYQWTVQGVVNRADGFTLQPGAMISLQNLTLDAATAYSFTVWTERPRVYGPNDARMLLGIGTTELTFILSEAIRSPWTIASATHSADQGSLYSIRIANVGSAPFTVMQNCVTNGEPNTAPSSCYFQNYSFDGSLSNWTVTGTIVPDPSGPLTGQIAVMSDLAALGQNVTLYEDGGGGDHEYTVILEGVLHGTDSASMIQVRYRFGGGGWILPDVNGWTIAQQTTALNALQRTYRIEFDVPSGTFAGLMEFQFDFTAAGVDEIGDELWLSLYSLCLSDAGSWSHHPTGGGSNWTPGGNGCDVSAPPVELQDDFGAWISYHLDGMQDIYYCDVIPQLEQLNNVTYGIYEYAQWTGLYSQAVQKQASTWASNALFPWLDGHLSNIARAAGGAVGVDVGGGCHDIFCLLEAVVGAVLGPIIDLVGRIVDTILGLVNTAIDVLLPLVEALVGFFVTLINGVGGILSALLTLITSFITGITNAQPAPVPGLPNCAIDPNSSAICAVMYGLEHTIFADEGAAIIPLFIAILSIVQLNWFIGKVTELIQEVTSRV